MRASASDDVMLFCVAENVEVAKKEAEELREARDALEAAKRASQKVR